METASVMLDDELKEKYNSLLACATQLCTRCSSLTYSGSTKLAKQCQSELAFLHRLANQSMKLSQLNSTNLYHLQGVVEAAEHLPDVTAVLKRFQLPSHGRHIIVDVVCCHGQTWVKIVARNSKALTTDLNGDGEYGSKTVLSQACEYHEAAQCHPHNFVPPRVVFLFTSEIVSSVSSALDTVHVCCESMDAVLQGTSELFDHSHNTQDESLPLSASVQCSDVDRVNLDVTTLISLVSNVCNGFSNIQVNDPVLSQQAAEEQASPSRPSIIEFINNKHLFVCETALRDFQAIVDVVGGPMERQRASDLLGRVKVVADEPSERSQHLQLTSNIRQRARTVFGTGDSLKAVTTTANVGFVRAAAQAGVQFVTFLHPARALTEHKQQQHCQMSIYCR